MVLIYKDLNKIEFPVYKIGSGDWIRADGLLFIDDQLVDDTNQDGETLGVRRMQTHFKDKYRLNKAIGSPNGILKQSNPYFIDSKGVPFAYQKTLMCALRYLKIEEVVPKGTASIIRVKGVRTPFTVPRPPATGMEWAGVLHLHGLPWMLYEYSDTKLKDTRRKV